MLTVSLPYINNVMKVCCGSAFGIRLSNGRKVLIFLLIVNIQVIPFTWKLE